MKSDQTETISCHRFLEFEDDAKLYCPAEPEYVTTEPSRKPAANAKRTSKTPTRVKKLPSKPVQSKAKKKRR